MTALRADQRQLLFASVALCAVLLVLVPLVLSRFPAFWAYHLTLVLYWLGFCLPVARRYGGLNPRLWGLGQHGRAAVIVPLLLAAQCAAVFAGALVPALPQLATGGLGLAILVALLNGPLEEAVWRGAYISTFSDRPLLGYGLGSALFALWHVPLALVAGVTFPGGPLALVGGATGLGLFWGAIAWRTGRIGWVAIAHSVTNIFAFAGLNAINAWP